MATDARGRKSRERQVHSVATPETVRKLDNVTIDRLYANGFLRGEHVDAWLEIHDAWKALSRGLGLRLMRWEEKTSSSGGGEMSARLERLISKYSDWHSTVEKDQHEVIIATIEGHSLKKIANGEAYDEMEARLGKDHPALIPLKRRISHQFQNAKLMLRNGLHEYCRMDGTI